jgi:hypothetical protein
LLTILIVGVYADLARQPSTELGFTDLPIVKADDLPCIDDPLEAWSEAELIIWQYKSTHYACRNMSTLLVHEIQTNLTRVEENALGNMTHGLLFLKEVVHNTSLTLEDDEIIIECYQGKYQYYSNLGQMLIPQLASDPSTAGWGAAEQGRMWYNTAEGKIKFWDGSTVQVLPSVGGGSSGGKGDYDYLVYKVSSTYYMMDADGNIDYSSTNASRVTEFAFGNLTVDRTGQETVYIKGDITITNSILIPDWTHLIIDGKITLSMGATCDIIGNKDTTGSQVTIEGGRLYGYDGGNAEIYGIHWHTTAATTFTKRLVRIQNMEIWMLNWTHASVYGGIYLETDAWSYSPIFELSNLEINGEDYGIRTEGVCDSTFGNIKACAHAGTGYSLYISGGGLNEFTGLRLDGPIYLYESRANTIGDFNIDMLDRNLDGVTLEGAQYTAVSNGVIYPSASGSAYTTKAGVLLSKTASYNCVYNSVSNVYVGRYNLTGTQRFAYGVQEDEASANVNYNLFCNINAADCASGNLVQGANSTISNSLPP